MTNASPSQRQSTEAKISQGAKDIPIATPGEDRYRTTRFGETLAARILEQSNPRGTVIAVLGPWGSGKSSAINLAKYTINEVDKGKSESSDKRIKIVEVPCWTYRGEDAIVRGILRSISEVISERSFWARLAMNGILRSAAGYNPAWDAIWGVTKGILPLAIAAFGAGALIGSVGTFFTRVTQFFFQNFLPTVAPTFLLIVFILLVTALFSDQLRKSLRRMLRWGANGLFTLLCSYLANFTNARALEQHQRRLVKALEKRKESSQLLVIVDDLDRLTPSEAHTILRVIRTLGDLPNVMFLLAFDQDVLEKYLCRILESGGESYLAKIVDIWFHLPRPTPDDLANELADSIRKNIPTLIGNGSSDRLDLVLTGLVTPLAKSPRDVARFVNSWSSTYETMKNDVDAADFLAIEALRHFRSALYYGLQDHRSSVTWDMGSEPTTLPRKVLDLFGGFLDEFSNTEKRDAQRALSSAFPTFSGLVKEGDEWKWDFEEVEGALQSYRRGQAHYRVCFEQYFDSYFRFGAWDVVHKQLEDI